MNPEAADRALDAIHDEALKALQMDMPEPVRRKLDLIVSLARYKFDVRSRVDKESDS